MNAIASVVLLVCSAVTPYLSEWILETMRAQNVERMLAYPYSVTNGFFFLSDLVFFLGVAVLAYLAVRREGRLWPAVGVFILGVGMLALSFAGWYRWVPNAWWVEPGTAPFRFAVFALLIGLVGVFVRLRARRKGHGSS